MGREFKVVGGQLFVIPSFSDEPLQANEKPFGLSIQKWQAIVDALDAGTRVISNGGPFTCALCRMPGGWADGCVRCPISVCAGSPRCTNYEYAAWQGAVSQEVSVEALLNVAKAELAFLRRVYQYSYGGK